MNEDNKAQNVVLIFEEFFGEDKVSFEDCENNRTRIHVHFPEVDIYNENNIHHTIYDLYARINITKGGKLIGNPCLGKSRFQYKELRSGYIHSHVSSCCGDYAAFNSCCLGNDNTPISKTVTSLQLEYSEEFWNLFCLQLSEYVTVESLEGVPYLRITELDNADLERQSSLYTMKNWYPNSTRVVVPDNMGAFIRYFTEHSQLDNIYIACSNCKNEVEIDNLTAFVIEVTNSLIRFDKEIVLDDCYLSELLTDAVIKEGGILYILSGSSAITQETIDEYNNAHHVLCTFKGQEIQVTLDNRTNVSTNSIQVVNPVFLQEIINHFNRIINVKQNIKRTYFI